MATSGQLGRSLDSTTIARVEEIKKRLAVAHQTSKEWLQCGSWLRSGVVRYEGPDGRERTWETVERTTRRGPVDGTDALSETNSHFCSFQQRICYSDLYPNKLEP